MTARLFALLGYLAGLWLLMGVTFSGQLRRPDIRIGMCVSLVSALVIGFAWLGSEPVPVAWEVSRPLLLALMGLGLSGAALLLDHVMPGVRDLGLVIKLLRAVLVPAILLTAGTSGWVGALNLPALTPFVITASLLAIAVPLIYVTWMVRRPGSYLQAIGWRRSYRQLCRSFAMHLVRTGFPEEFFYRLFLLGLLSVVVGPYPAILAVSLLFGLVHTAPGKRPLPAALVFAVAVQGSLGLMLSFVFLGSQSLWPCVLLHASANAVFRVGSDAMARYSGSTTNARLRRG